jgi:opacity protein-like surface antigen
MKRRRACMVFFAIAVALPGAADEPVWQYDVGLRLGGVGAPPFFLPLAGSVSAFYEARQDRNWALRPALEITGGREWTFFGDTGYDVGINRAGAAMDFVFYTSPEKPVGKGFFLTAGAGLHRFAIKKSYERYVQGQWVEEEQRDTQYAASLSAGLGYQFGNDLGMEMKYCKSNQDSKLAGGIGRDWLTASVNLRFQAPGRRREEHPRDIAYRARKIAERAETDRLPLWKHKIGASLDFWPMEHDSAYSIFYENHLDGHWAVRPALDIVHGSVTYTEDLISGGRDMGIDGAGLSVDCIYYASESRRNGTGPYLLAGLGARWVSMKDEAHKLLDGTEVARREHSGAAPALSVGMGYYFGRYCGVEYRYSISTLDSPFGDVGKNWWRLGLNFRFPAPGQARDEAGAEGAEALGGPPWKHKFGLRVGFLLVYPETLSVFYERQLDRHWAIRPSIELMADTGGYYNPPPGPSPRAAQVKAGVIDPDYTNVSIDRVGATVDCIYYVFRGGGIGTGAYLLAGLSAHSIDMKDEEAWVGWEKTHRQTSGVAPALSLGLGFHFNRYFGVEYKHTFSALDTVYPEKMGKNWAWLSLNFRFPVPGLAKGNWPQGRH